MITNYLKEPYYYLYNWKIAPSSENVRHWTELAAAAFPLLTLYRPAAQPLSCGICFWNMGAHTYQFLSSPKDKYKLLFTMKEIVKNGAELVGTCFQQKCGLLIHTSIGLGETLFTLWKNPQDKVVEKVISLVSYGLILNTLFRKRSFKWTMISLLFQSSVSFYHMYSTYKKSPSNKFQMLTASTHGLAGITRLFQTYNAYKLFTTPRYFTIIRHADRPSGKDPSLNEKGIERAKQAGAQVRTMINKELGKEQILLVASTLKRSQETAQLMANDLGVSSKDIQIEDRIKERVSNGLPDMSRKERHEDPRYIAYQQLDKDKQFFTTYNLQDPKAESGHDLANRFYAAVDDILDTVADPETVPVLVSHATVTQNYMKGLKLDGHQITATSIKGLSNCEYLVIQKIGDRYSEVLRGRPVFNPSPQNSETVAASAQ